MVAPRIDSCGNGGCCGSGSECSGVNGHARARGRQRGKTLVLTVAKTEAVAAVEAGTLLAVTELVTADETGAETVVFGGGGIHYDGLW